MDSARHERASELFLAALEREPAERAGWLEEACGGDGVLRAEVESLLAADRSAGADFLTATSGAAETAMHAVELTGPPPARIGPFRIVGVLGEGGMGVVYEAEQASPRRAVALKVLRMGLATQAARRRFEYEAEVLGRLNHPGIARIHQAGTSSMPEGDLPYFAMELVRGQPLTEYVREHRLELEARLALFREVCGAVQHAHQRGVVHRDLKPSNILVDGSGAPHVLDFGVARAVEVERGDGTWATRFGALVGTLPYMSPEQAAGEKGEVDTRSDVYALGVLLFELVSDELPIDVAGLPVPAALRAIAEQPARRLGQLRRALRGDLETIAAKALHKDKELRYASATDLAADVERFQSLVPIVARPPSVAYTLGKFARRNTPLVVGATAALAGLVLALVVIGSSLSRALDAEAAADENLQEVERFADQLLAVELIEQAAELYPREARLVRAYDDWLRRAQELLDRRPEHARFAGRLEAETLTEQVRAGLVAEGAGEPAWALVEVGRRWRHRMARETLAVLDGLAAASADIEARRRFAAGVQELTLVEHGADWAEAREGIRASAWYGDLDLPPQLGLVPLGADPSTGLWEFWVLGTGERPTRDPARGEWRVTGETGVVLVLVPGGWARLGATPPGEEQPLSEPHVDPLASHREGPVHRVELDPFLLSKYELTQGQYQRITGRNPSVRAPDAPPGLAHPVENLSWEEAAEVVQRLGLALPTEAQWEYAARAGTSSIWWTGGDPRSLVGKENLVDPVSLAGHEELGSAPDPRLAGLQLDSWVYHAPVGSLVPNPWGLFDIAGNVAEWVDEARSEYETAARPGDGRRAPAPGARTHLRRGGSFRSPLHHSHSATRVSWPSGNRADDLGLRPARALAR